MTKEQELAQLLDTVFDCYPARPDFSAVRELAFLSDNHSWLVTELLKVMWLYMEDPSAFDEYLWSLNVPE